MAKYNNGVHYIILDSITASGADVAVANGVITAGSSTSGKLQIPYNEVVPGGFKKQIKVAEVLQVSTGTPTAADDTEYWVSLGQQVGNQYVTRKFTITSGTSATATTIVTALKAAINANAELRVAATGTTTLIITAEAGYPKFAVAQSANIAMVATTAGVTARNTGAILDGLGFDVTTTNNYTSYAFEYVSNHKGANPNQYTPLATRVVVFANEGDTDITDFCTAMDNAASALAGGVADPEAIAIG